MCSSSQNTLGFRKICCEVLLVQSVIWKLMSLRNCKIKGPLWIDKKLINKLPSKSSSLYSDLYIDCDYQYQ